MEEFSGKAFGF